MKQFPDESVMERSQDGSEVIRGGTIGLNRVLNRFVDRSTKDHKPEFSAVIMSAYTIFRNVWTMNNDANMLDMERDFIKDVNLFLDYYDTYLSFVKTGFFQSDKQCPVVIYFPDYRRVEKEIRREQTGKRLDLIEKYAKFLSRYSGKDDLVRKLDHVNCFWVRAGDATYPHREVVRKFRDISSHKSSAYSSGDKIALMSHIPLDYHISGRLRGIHLLQSYTGELKGPDQFRFQLDKEGRIPFTSTTHVVFGDSVLIKPWVTPKVRKILFEQAEKEKWLSRSEDDIRNKISKTANIPYRDLRKFDFV